MEYQRCYVKNSDAIKSSISRNQFACSDTTALPSANGCAAELREHLYTLPDRPDGFVQDIVYQERWGFCLSQSQLDSLAEGCMKWLSTLLLKREPDLCRVLHPGERSYEVLISVTFCHPSIATTISPGSLSALSLQRSLRGRRLRYSYRFIFIPGTIGAITWMALNEKSTDRIKHGLVVANVGDSGKMNYKKSRRGDAEIDRQSPTHSGTPVALTKSSTFHPTARRATVLLSVLILPWDPDANTMGRYPEYHTSADDLSLVQPIYLADSCKTYFSVLDILKYQLLLEPKSKMRAPAGQEGTLIGHGGNVKARKPSCHALGSEPSRMGTTPP